MERGEIALRLGAPRPGPRGAGGGGGGGRRRCVHGLLCGRGFLGRPRLPCESRVAIPGARRTLAGSLQEGAAGERGWLMIPSGGSAGALKFARHDGWSVAAAVEGFRAHFGLERVNAVGVLPLHHVSGLMAWMRCALTGGVFIPWSWKDLEEGRRPASLPEDCCLSLVPTQLQRLLSSAEAVAWLRQFRFIFVGGGPAWAGLLENAARLELPLSPCYGATETAAMVAALRPEQFLAGIRGCGAPMPHAAIDFVDGVVRIAGESLFRGYYPALRDERSWLTEDMGGITAEGSLVILGRRDDLIVTGGRKVSPLEVEAALRLSGRIRGRGRGRHPRPRMGPGGRRLPSAGRSRTQDPGDRGGARGPGLLQAAQALPGRIALAPQPAGQD